MSHVNASKYFLQKYTEALVVCAAMKYFGMETITDAPTINKPDETTASVSHHLGQLLDEFAIPSNTDMSAQPQRLHCPYKCGKQYKTLNGLMKHIRTKHGPDTEVPPQDQPQDHERADQLYNYSRTALSLSLLAWDFHDATQLADGERVVRLYKYLMLYFKASDKTKYSYHSLRLLAQLKCFLTERKAHELTHNRFVNNKGGIRNNHPCDLDMEFRNRTTKEQCVGFRGKVTPAAVKRVSEASQRIEEAMDTYDQESKVKKQSGKNEPESHEKDVTTLIQKMLSEKPGIFEVKPGRYHHAFPDFPSSPLARLNHADLSKWISDTLTDLSSKSSFRM